jgi:uncharacterized membrane-anchored protein
MAIGIAITIITDVTPCSLEQKYQRIPITVTEITLACWYLATKRYDVKEASKWGAAVPCETTVSIKFELWGLSGT